MSDIQIRQNYSTLIWWEIRKIMRVNVEKNCKTVSMEVRKAKQELTYCIFHGNIKKKGNDAMM